MWEGPGTFFALPLEIREQIYKLVLPYSLDWKVTDSWSTIASLARQTSFTGRPALADSEAWSVRWFPGSAPGVLAVNRQMHNEAGDVLYRENAFEIYIKHPMEPRLPMNEGHADEESFVLIAWAHKHWCHPRNPKIPLSAVKTHRGLRRARKWHVNLPSLDPLIGIDVYMRVSSSAKFYGITAWINRRVQEGGKLTEQEQDRMIYTRHFKNPLDEVAAYLGDLNRIEQLGMTLALSNLDIHCLEFLVEGFYDIQRMEQVKLFPRLLPFCRVDRVHEHPMHRTICQIEADLQNRKEALPPTSIDPSLSSDAIEMYKMLKSIRKRQLLDSIDAPLEA